MYMRIIDLDDERKEEFLICLEDWSEDAKESGDHKACWYEKMKDKNLGVKLAIDDNGVTGGMIQYVPIEYSPATGKDLFFISCIWVHGHKKGRGSFQKKGMGTALLKAAEEDVKKRGAKGIAAWGIKLPFWMKASWYAKKGYEYVDEDGIACLMFKKFSDEAEKPVWYKGGEKPQKGQNPGKVTVTAFNNGNCMVQNLALERAKKACKEIGEKAVYQEIDTTITDNFKKWGVYHGVYIEDKIMQKGPPLKYKKIKKMILKQVKRIK
jgi:GNAT superfamily N-acetyltransferase